MWVPVHNEEWEGDVPIGSDSSKKEGNESESGKVVFQGDALPWQIGKYEVRYRTSIVNFQGVWTLRIPIPNRFAITMTANITCLALMALSKFTVLRTMPCDLWLYH